MAFLLTLTPELLGLPSVKESIQQSPSWQLQARCEEESAESCIFLQQLVELHVKSQRDGSDALLALKKLFTIAKSGMPITHFYNSKQCHEAHTFKIEGVEHKIWRIRKASIRIYFYYSEGKIIYLAALKAKRQDKLTTSELKQLQDEVSVYLQSKKDNLLKVIPVNN